MERQNITPLKRLFSATSKTSFFKPIDLKLFQEGKKKESRPDVQQQPELDSTSPEFLWEVLGPTDDEIHCWGPILMPFAYKRKEAIVPTSSAKVNGRGEKDKRRNHSLYFLEADMTLASYHMP